MDSSLSPEQVKYVLQFQHPEKLLSRLPGVSPALVAQLFEIDEDLLAATRREFTANAQHAAQELFEDDRIRDNLKQLPFADGQTLVALADSITDDWQSWFEILRHLLALAGRDLRLVNRGISGDTTVHAICRFLEIVEDEPDWIFCFLGTNDCRRHGLQPAKVLVSHEETAKNYAMLRNFAATQTSAKWVWLTPCRVIEDAIAAHWFLGSLQLAWRNEELDRVADIVRSQPDPHVDLQPLFKNPGNLLLDDGLHPNLAGQKAICRAVLDHLAQQS